MPGKSTETTELVPVIVEVIVADTPHYTLDLEPMMDEVTATEIELEVNFHSLSIVATELGLSGKEYVRKLLLEGKFSGVKVQHKGFTKWYIWRPSIDLYREYYSRSEQPKRYYLTMRPDDYLQARIALSEAGIEYKLKRAPSYYRRKGK